LLQNSSVLKVSNETKIGALTVIAITILILGFNFLKGRSLFSKPKQFYAVFDKINGLPASTATVMMKGLPIGVTGEAVESDESVSSIIVPIKLNKNVRIPANSVAVITGSALGISSSVLEIKPGNDTLHFLKPGDHIATNASPDLLNEVTKQLNPVLFQVQNAVQSLDSVLKVIGRTFDPNTKSNFQGILANVNKTTASLIQSSASLQQLLNMQSGALAQSLNNVNSFTGNLAKNNDKINALLANLEKASKNVAELKLDETMSGLNKSITELNAVIKSFSNDKGTLGKLLNDPALYQQMNNLTFSINTLVDDLKVNPKRYLSLFGRKDKKIKALERPLNDSVPPPAVKDPNQ
jgi:phospholipid/cholesterol/gamma-HCH transport system substrate-binding protein